MLKVDIFTSQATDQFDLAFRHIFKQACQKIRNWMSSEMLDDFERKITKWAPHPTVLAKYPFFGDLKSFSATYCSCFLLVVNDKEKTCSLMFDKEQAVQKGIPSNITDVLEYGDPIGVPPITHLLQWSEHLGTIIQEVFFQESL